MPKELKDLERKHIERIIEKTRAHGNFKMANTEDSYL
jgi:hypothetical protein